MQLHVKYIFLCDKLFIAFGAVHRIYSYIHRGWFFVLNIHIAKCLHGQLMFFTSGS